jgi:hypothetical protein
MALAGLGAAPEFRGETIRLAISAREVAGRERSPPRGYRWRLRWEYRRRGRNPKNTIGRSARASADVLPGNSLVVGLSPFEENGHEAEAI